MSSTRFFAIFEVFVGTWKKVGVVRSFQIFKEENLHDLYVVNLDSVSHSEMKRYHNKPIRLLWFHHDWVTMFHGYLRDDDPVANSPTSSLGDSAIAYCMGPSSRVTDTISRKWKDKTVSQVAGDIVAPYGLGIEVDDPGTVFEWVSQSSQTNWEVLRDITDRVGNSLVADNAKVRIVDPKKELMRSLNAKIPVYRIPYPGKVKTKVKNYKTNFTHTNPQDWRSTLMEGVTETGNEFKWKFAKGGGVDAIPTSVYQEAKHQYLKLIDSIEEDSRLSRLERYGQVIELTCDGFEFTKPGKCIWIDDTYDPRLRLSSYWYVFKTVLNVYIPGERFDSVITACRTREFLMKKFSRRVLRTSRSPDPVPVFRYGNWQSNKQWRVTQ